MSQVVSVLATIQAVVTCVVLAVLSYLLARAPGNVPLRAITVTVGTFALTVVFGGAARDGATVLGLAPILSRLIQHLGMLVGGYSLIAFYLFAALDRDRARRKAMWQAIPLAVAAAAMVVATAVMPSELHNAAATLAFARTSSAPPDLTIVVLYVAANGYMGYAFACAVLWTRRHARGAEPQLRRGLAVTAVGLASLAAGEAVFVTATILRWTGVAVPRWPYSVGLLGVIPGSVVFMIGFVYPAVRMRLAAMAVWWQHRRTYYLLRPLWTMMHLRFPEDMLGRVPAARWREALSLRGVHRRYYRRVIECRDGLVRISPYLGPDDGRPLAERVRGALLAHALGSPAPARAIPVAIPAADGLDADVRELIALSEQLRTMDTGEKGVPRSTGLGVTGSTEPPRSYTSSPVDAAGPPMRPGDTVRLR